MDEVVEVVGISEEMPTIKEYIEMVKKRKHGAALVEQIVPDNPGDCVIVAGENRLKENNVLYECRFLHSHRHSISRLEM